MAKSIFFKTDEKKSALSALNKDLKKKKYSNARYFILVDEHSYEHCLPVLISEVEALQEAEFFEVECGEACKNLAVAENLWSSLLDSRADRNSIIINLGGGAICDLGGFVASAYMRGIRFINVPTTLLSMVDAAIGGKTAINLNGSKNSVGFFNHPTAICIEPQFLDTLPQRELLSGFFEMLKTAIVYDKNLYISLLEQLKNKQLNISTNDVYTCALIKNDIVNKDFKDNSLRKILNFGHTIGHMIESFSLQHDSTPLSHGEAVALGMISETFLSVKKLGFSSELFDELKTTILSILPAKKYSNSDFEELLNYICVDKKNINGEIRCVLLKDIACAEIDICINTSEIRESINIF